MFGDIAKLKIRFIYRCIESTGTKQSVLGEKNNINNHNKMVEEIYSGNLTYEN